MSFKDWFANKHGFVPDGRRWFYATGENFENTWRRLADGVAEYVDEQVARSRSFVTEQGIQYTVKDRPALIPPGYDIGAGIAIPLDPTDEGDAAIIWAMNDEIERPARGMAIEDDQDWDQLHETEDTSFGFSRAHWKRLASAALRASSTVGPLPRKRTR